MKDHAEKMKQDDLIPGSIVRYNETGSRWFIAVLRRVLTKDIELEYLGGDREKVPIEKVEDFSFPSPVTRACPFPDASKPLLRPLW